jgi:hypothetical protein
MPADFLKSQCVAAGNTFVKLLINISLVGGARARLLVDGGLGQFGGTISNGREPSMKIMTERKDRGGACSDHA